MQRFQVFPRSVAAASLLLLSTLLLCAPGARALGGGMHPAGVSGVVRDAQGVAQMGVLVQVLGSGTAPGGSAFTDAHGRYRIGGLQAGNYRVRASATLFVPAVQTNLLLESGATRVVNLTLSALFDAAQWLPAQRRGTSEPEDDWKWTLRSAANRPILRWTDEDNDSGAAATTGEARGAHATLKGRVTVEGQSGGFGEGAARGMVSLSRESAHGSHTDLQAVAGSASAASSLEEVRVAYGRGTGSGIGSGSETEMSLRWLNHAELRTEQASDGLQVIELTSGHRLALGSHGAIEAGTELEALRLGTSTIVLHPFLRIEAQPNDTWAIGLRLASDPDLQSLADVRERRGEPPVAAQINGRLKTATGMHEELAVAHKIGRSTVEIACFHDDQERMTLRGGVARGASGPDVLSLRAEALVDPTTGSFRELGPGVHGTGGRVRVRTPISPTLWLETEYAVGEVLQMPHTGRPATLSASSTPKPGLSSTASAAVDGRIRAAGTKLRVAYRWQPGSTVTAVDPYGDGRNDAYLGVTLRQPVRWAGHLPEGLEATLDLANLLAQGYRPFLSADGHTLYLAQMPRTLQAGLSFSF